MSAILNVSFKFGSRDDKELIKKLLKRNDELQEELKKQAQIILKAELRIKELEEKLKTK